MPHSVTAPLLPSPNSNYPTCTVISRCLRIAATSSTTPAADKNFLSPILCDLHSTAILPSDHCEGHCCLQLRKTALLKQTVMFRKFTAIHKTQFAEDTSILTFWQVSRQTSSLWLKNTTGSFRRLLLVMRLSKLGMLSWESCARGPLMTLLLPSNNCANQTGDGDLLGVTWTARSSPNNGINIEPSASQPNLTSFKTKLFSVTRTQRLCSGSWTHSCTENLRPCCLWTPTWVACALSSMTSLSVRCGISELVYHESRSQLWTMIVRRHPPLRQLLRHWTLPHPMNCTSWSEGVPPSPALLTPCCWQGRGRPSVSCHHQAGQCVSGHCCRSHLLEKGACDSSPKQSFTRQ